MVIQIGTLVLCHLIIKTSAGVSSEKIEQVPGIVKEISYVDKIEMFEDKYAVKTKKTMLLVEPEEKDKIFRIGVDACRPVVDEQTHIEMARKKMRERQERLQESQPAMTTPKKKDPAPVATPQDTPVSTTSSPDDTSDLLNSLKGSDKAPKTEEKPVSPKKVSPTNSSDKEELLKQLEE